MYLPGDSGRLVEPRSSDLLVAMQAARERQGLTANAGPRISCARERAEGDHKRTLGSAVTRRGKAQGGLSKSGMGIGSGRGTGWEEEGEADERGRGSQEVPFSSVKRSLHPSPGSVLPPSFLALVRIDTLRLHRGPRGRRGHRRKHKPLVPSINRSRRPARRAPWVEWRCRSPGQKTRRSSTGLTFVERTASECMSTVKRTRSDGLPIASRHRRQSLIHDEAILRLDRARQTQYISYGRVRQRCVSRDELRRLSRRRGVRWSAQAQVSAWRPRGVHEGTCEGPACWLDPSSTSTGPIGDGGLGRGFDQADLAATRSRPVSSSYVPSPITSASSRTNRPSVVKAKPALAKARVVHETSPDPEPTGSKRSIDLSLPGGLRLLSTSYALCRRVCTVVIKSPVQDDVGPQHEADEEREARGGRRLRLCRQVE